VRWCGPLSIALHAVALVLLLLDWRREPPQAAQVIEIALLMPEPPPPPPPEVKPEPEPPPVPIVMPELPKPPPLPEPEPLELDEPLPELLAEQPIPEVVLPKPKPERPKPKVVERAPPPEPTPEPVAQVAPPPPAPPAPPAAAAPPAPPRPSGPPPGYLARLLAELERHKSYPRHAQTRRLQGTALLHFTLTRDGHVAAWRIERSSGHDSLDGAVETMIRKADLPPLPPEIAGDKLDVVVPVSFVLR